jgi:flagellar FliL protein
MSDATAVDENETLSEDQDGEGEGEPKQVKRFSGKKIILLIVLPLLLLLGAGGGGAYYYFFMMGPTPEELAAAEAEREQEVNLNAVYYDLPEMLVNLNNGGKKASYLKLRVAVELDAQEDVARLESVLPRVIDNFQVFLRELRLEDLSGSAGLMRLKEELLIRVNLAAKPVPIKDVLFKEMLVQ